MTDIWTSKEVDIVVPKDSLAAITGDGEVEVDSNSMSNPTETDVSSKVSIESELASFGSIQ